MFTSYNASGKKHARGIYMITSLFHTPKNDDFLKPFVVKIGMSQNLYSRMRNYDLYYPEGFWCVGFVFVPLTWNASSIRGLESAIHTYPSIKKHKYRSEWFSIPGLDYIVKEIRKVLTAHPEAILICDLTKRLNLSSKYIPVRLKDAKVIQKIAEEQREENDRLQKLREARKRKVAVPPVKRRATESKTIIAIPCMRRRATDPKTTTTTT